MKLPKNLSGLELVKILTKHYGWQAHRREGSHITLKKENAASLLTVPLHKQLDTGTLLAILRKAKIERDDFIEKV